jgi:hypothetical protein
MSNLGDRAKIEADIRAGSRKIRNFEITASDLLPLFLDKKKIPGSTINAYGAILQQKAEEQEIGDWCIFSSWLGPLVGGIVEEGKTVGTINEHIMAAVSVGPCSLKLRVLRVTTVSK